MKQWLTFLLLLITLTGTLYPCCLQDECNDKETAATGKENKQPADAGCSPFFACASCAGFTTMHKQVLLTQPATQQELHHESIIIFNLSTYASSFWQPPRYC